VLAGILGEPAIRYARPLDSRLNPRPLLQESVNLTSTAVAGKGREEHPQPSNRVCKPSSLHCTATAPTDIVPQTEDGTCISSGAVYDSIRVGASQDACAAGLQQMKM
jgi:hypothetical protein